MSTHSERHTHRYIMILAFIVPVFGLAADSAYGTKPLITSVGLIIGIVLFLWSYLGYRKEKREGEMRAVDWISRGCTYQIAGNHQEAVIAFTRASEIEPAVAITYYARGRSHLELGNLQEAIKDFTRAVELNPRFAEAYEKRGVSFTKMAQFEEALKDFDRAIEINPRLAEAYHNRAALHEKLGNKEQSIKDTQTAMQLGCGEAQKLLRIK